MTQRLIAWLVRQKSLRRLAPRAMAVMLAIAVGQVTALSAVLGQVTVSGIAYDSLHASRLSGAFLRIAGTAQTATSDSEGRFAFDRVVPGTYTIVVQHDALDAIGMSGATARASVTDGRDTIRISVPSLATLWRIACHTAPPPDSGIVFGTVRAAGGRSGQPGAAVRGDWLDIGVDKKVISQRQWHLDTNADSTGNYVLCGVPLTTGIQVRATAGTTATGLIDLQPLDKERIERRDLVLGGATTPDSLARGVVVGLVTGDKGPLSNARVDADSVAAVRTGDDGRFILRGVPAGTQQIEVLALGQSPVSAIVDVIAGDTARVDVHLGKVTVLDSVQVHAEAIARQRLVLGYLERKRTTVQGYFRDSTTLGRENEFSGMFKDMPMATFHSVPGGGFTIELLSRTLTRSISSRAPATCSASLWIDRMRVPPKAPGLMEPDPQIVTMVLGALHPQDIAAIEVYPTSDDTPIEFGGHVIFKNGSEPPCGAVVIWTKRGWPDP